MVGDLLAVLCVLLLLVAFVGLMVIWGRANAGVKRETEAGDWSMNGNFFTPPPPGKGFSPQTPDDEDDD